MAPWTIQSLVPVLEALLFCADHPISLKELKEVIPDAPEMLLKDALSELLESYNSGNRGTEIVEVANGYRMQTRAEYKKWVTRSLKKVSNRLSKPALETLAIIAYKQPVTRAEIERVRGVDSNATIRQLISRGLVKIAGRKDVPGKPLLYGTTRHFLEVFQLKDIKALPSVQEMGDS